MYHFPNQKKPKHVQEIFDLENDVLSQGNLVKIFQAFFSRGILNGDTNTIQPKSCCMNCNLRC